jgi:DNA-binding transcriptional regulator GbsR (MarR family)
MPGGRLTQLDREAIAAGLADGLSAAEIARRLERPTSTVSREILRNGRPAGYQADTAQQTTAQRARRSKRSAMPTEAATDYIDGRDRPALTDAADFFTATLVQSGVPRMMARVLTCLYLTDAGSLTAAELVQRLHVSPASISTAVAGLENHGLITREHAAAGRRERYTVDDRLWYRSWLASVRQNQNIADAARSAAEVLGAETRAGSRLTYTADFLQFVGRDMLKAAEHWWSELAARHPADGEA